MLLTQRDFWRFADAARWLAAQGRIRFFPNPALIPHPDTPGLGNVPGYYQAVPLKRDWSVDWNTFPLRARGFCVTLGIITKRIRSFSGPRILCVLS